MKEFGEQIKIFRKRANLTQTQLGEIIGVKKSTIQKYESGAITTFSITTLKRIAEAVNTPIGILMGEPSSVTSLKAFLEIHLSPIGLQIFTELHKMDREGHIKVLIYTRDIQHNYLVDLNDEEEF